MTSDGTWDAWAKLNEHVKTAIVRWQAEQQDETRMALIEAMVVLEALYAAGGTGLTDEIEAAVFGGRAVLFGTGTVEGS